MGRGITYYNFTSDQFTGFHGIVIPGTLRNSLFLLAGLLEHQTSLQLRELITDTAGYSDVVFGLFWLLGYQFSPINMLGRYSFSLPESVQQGELRLLRESLLEEDFE